MPAASPFPLCNKQKFSRHYLCQVSWRGWGVVHTVHPVENHCLQLLPTEVTNTIPHMGAPMLSDISQPGGDRVSIQAHVEWRFCFVSMGPPDPGPQLPPSCHVAPSSADNRPIQLGTGVHAWESPFIHPLTHRVLQCNLHQSFICYFHGLNATSLYMQRSFCVTAVGQVPNCSSVRRKPLYSYKI